MSDEIKCPAQKVGLDTADEFANYWRFGSDQYLTDFDPDQKETLLRRDLGVAMILLLKEMRTVRRLIEQQIEVKAVPAEQPRNDGP